MTILPHSFIPKPMDDRNFSEATARQWINAIEVAQNSARDQDIYPMLTTWLEDQQIENVLELGCGQGICSDKIDLDSREYTGVEASALMVERAKQLYPQANRTFTNGNIYELVLQPASFDGIFSVAVWHLLSDLNKAASEMGRILEAQGNFLIITANPGAYDLWKSFFSEVKLEGKRLEGVMQFADGTESKDVLYLHTLEEIKNSFQANNCKVLKTHTFRGSEETGLDQYIAIYGQKN